MQPGRFEAGTCVALEIRTLIEADWEVPRAHHPGGRVKNLLPAARCFGKRGYGDTQFVQRL